MKCKCNDCDGYTIHNHLWDSKQALEDYKNDILPKLHEALDKGYSVEWGGCSNWVKLTKFMGSYKAPDKLCTNMKLYCDIKVFSESSTHGINNGKISKMGIILRPSYPNTQFNRENQIWFFNYDRGPDSDALGDDKEAKKMYDDIIKIFN